jgi:hypothetical protein
LGLVVGGEAGGAWAAGDGVGRSCVRHPGEDFGRDIIGLGRMLCLRVFEVVVCCGFVSS